MGGYEGECSKCGGSVWVGGDDGTGGCDGCSKSASEEFKKRINSGLTIRTIVCGDFGDEQKFVLSDGSIFVTDGRIWYIQFLKG